MPVLVVEITVMRWCVEGDVDTSTTGKEARARPLLVEKWKGRFDQIPKLDRDKLNGLELGPSIVRVSQF